MGGGGQGSRRRGVGDWVGGGVGLGEGGEASAVQFMEEIRV